MNQLPDKLLTDYTHGFFGYGSWKAKIWFVGMEEGGGGSLEDVVSRLVAWDKKGRKKLQDLRSFHVDRGETRWHLDSPRLQRTWKQLIRMHLLAHGESDSWQEMVRFQQNEFGKIGGDVCSIELLSLPSPGLDTWHYANWSKLSWLKTRDCYTDFLLRDRVSTIQKAIKLYRPPVVVFYGSSWWRRWAMIAQENWRQAIQGRMMGCERDGVAYYVTRHPARQSNAYFSEIGNYLKQKHGSQI